MVLSRIKKLMEDNYSYERKFNVEKSDKVFGYTEEIIDNGVLITVLTSLWKERKTRDFFVLITFEGNKKQKYYYLESWKAKELINQKSPTNIKEQLIFDWISCHDRAL